MWLGESWGGLVGVGETLRRAGDGDRAKRGGGAGCRRDSGEIGDGGAR